MLTNNNILVYGIGGIGKSYICRKLFWNYYDSFSDGIEYLAWIQYNGDLNQSIMSSFYDPETNLDNIRKKYENHPVFRFVRLNCVPCKDLKVTINTDDKGIFVTSLQRELSLLALALKKQKVKGERNKWGEISINKYIGKLARNGQEQRFK